MNPFWLGALLGFVVGILVAAWLVFDGYDRQDWRQL